MDKRVQEALDQDRIARLRLREKMILKDWKYFFLKDLEVMSRNYKMMDFVVDGDNQLIETKLS